MGEPSLPRDLAEREGIDLSGCDGTGACSAVCPVADSFDFLPHQIVRQVILNCRDRVFRSTAIWLCTDCGACTAACPHGVGVAKLMSELRRRAHRYGVEPPPEAEGAKASIEALLEEMHGSGRLSPGRVALSYKCRSFDLFTDLGVGLSLAKGRRLGLFPDRGGKQSPRLVALAKKAESARKEAELDRMCLRRHTAIDADASGPKEADRSLDASAEGPSSPPGGPTNDPSGGDRS